MTILFQNPGEIDIRGATIAGLSAKDGDTPIGFFGTGLKYSIACILRWGGTISIFAGEAEYKFTLEQIDFRGKQFEQVCMNGVPLGFTTEYGKAWLPWQVFRELYANALDEKGTVQRIASFGVSPNTTTIVVRCKEVEDEFPGRDQIILPPNLPYELDDKECAILDRPAAHLFFRGVRVRSEPTGMTYNVKRQMALTEDRTLMGTSGFKDAVRNCIASSGNEALIGKFLRLAADEKNWESEIDFGSWNTYGETFLDIAARLYQQSRTKFKFLKGLLDSERPSITEEQPLKLTKLQQKMLDKAVQLVASMGIPAVTTEPIVILDLGKERLGQCNMSTGKVYLSPRVFEQGTKQVVSTLYEEMLHKTSGLHDCTYEMQTFLFNKLVSMYEEHVWEEPC